MKKTAVSLLVLAISFALIFPLYSIRASDRSEAPSDAAYANFRNVQAGAIGSNTLYRSVHPANSSKRAPYANQLAKENGIRTVLNLADSRMDLEKRFINNKIPPSYYYRSLCTKGKIYAMRMNGVGKYYNSYSRRQITEGLKFFAKNEGPYLVHCEIGRDRTGFTILLLESLMGAPYQYMLEDFTRSDINLYGRSYSKSKKKAVTRLNSDLNFITGKSKKTDWSRINLTRYAADFLKKGGMSAGEIAVLKKNLSKSYPKKGSSSDSGPAEDSPSEDGSSEDGSSESSSPGGGSSEGGSSDGGSSEGSSPDGGSSEGGSSDGGSSEGSSPGGSSSEDSSSGSSSSDSSSKTAVPEETPAFRCLSINGKTKFTATIKAGKTVTYKYKVEKGSVRTYPVEWKNTNKSTVRVRQCGNGRLILKGIRKGSAIIRLRDRNDHVKRVKITVRVVK